MVKVYSTVTCPWCRRAKQFLTQHNIPYEDLDVGSNVTARNEMVKKSGQLGVPVIDIDGEIIIGFDEPKIRHKFSIP
ncbi:MAG: glutaredoxin domain-containing protein [Chloroflexota bacterium]